MRWSPRRQARRPHTPQPPAGWPSLVSLSLPDETPPDVRDLARTACLDGPGLLAGFSPDDAGLVLVHPRSEAALPDFARRGRVLATVEPIEELEALARRLNLAGRRRPGWFGCLLVGIETSGFIHLAPASRVAFERRAS